MSVIYKDGQFYGAQNVKDIFLPVGSIIPMMSNHAPKNTLICDGTVYNIADYLQLANFFETEFGSINYFGGDGETTFAVPDLRGEFLRGSGANSHSGEGSGTTVGTHQNSTKVPVVGVQPNLYLTMRSGKTNSTYGSVWYEDPDIRKNNSGQSTPINVRVSGTETTTGGTETAIGVRPTNTSVLYVIVYKNIYADVKDLFTAGDGINISEESEISTDNMPSADMSEILSPLPSITSRMPILFDETGEEKIIGWYRLANGTKKLLYEKTLIVNLPTTSAKTGLDVELISSTDAANMELIYGYGRYIRSDGYTMLLPLAVTNVDNGLVYASARIQQYTDKSIKIQYRTYSAQPNTAIVYATVQYIKTTD